MADTAWAAINTSVVSFEAGVCSDPVATVQLELVGRQVTEFAALRMSDHAAVTTV